MFCQGYWTFWLVIQLGLVWSLKSPEDPFLCPEADCESEECHHLERSGLCDVVAKGDLEMTVLNCGCCFLCSDRRPGI
ncbi:uncharacterized protein CDAR_568791 [Caerostris darwini]|uniref:Uncharacterized protein n=1 Tax=Caerostris darwini TaxID=1538125 RepID=A0AAV4MH33_9ARAC|nr:uncharacterized protein CDAR_568791 [Caerostris darwini]